MKKKILLLLLALCICFSCMLSSCDKKQTEPTGEGVTQTTKKVLIRLPEYIYAHEFETYTSLIEAFNGETDSVLQKDIDRCGDDYRMFVDYLTETKNIMIPMWNDRALTLRREINIFRYELYSLPWIWYYGDYQGEQFIVNTTYPAFMAIEGITNDMSASDVIYLIDKGAINLHNYHKDERVEYAYTKTLVLADATVSALIWKFKNSNQIFVSFYYKDTLVKFHNYDKILPDEFWKDFSMESVADGALSSHPES